MHTELPHLSLILGGASSGKSAFAERLVVASARPMTYVATAEAFDEEMRVKIVTHKARRGPGWTTIEAPRDLTAALTEVDPAGAVLVDCATLWLTNHLMADSDLATEETRLLKNLAICPAPVVMVSNEVGTGIVPENALTRRFRDAQGRLNQGLAARASLVVMVTAGLPTVLKGALPEAVE